MSKPNVILLVSLIRISQSEIIFTTRSGYVYIFTFFKFMSTYQHLQNYKGSLYGNLNYTGLEYDYEVPDNIVIASPGGTSATHHHYTKGMYSDAVSMTDIHAGNPLADAYPYGEYGNIYQQGQSATRLMGDFLPGADMNAGNNYTSQQTQVRKENFSNVEMIPPADTVSTTPITDSTDSDKKRAQFENILKLVAIFAVSYLAVNFFQKGGEDLVVTKFFGDRLLTWKDYFITGGVFAMLAVALAYLFNISFNKLEKI